MRKVINAVLVLALAVFAVLNLGKIGTALQQADEQLQAGIYHVFANGLKVWTVQSGASVPGPAAGNASALGLFNVSASSYTVSVSTDGEVYVNAPIGLPIYTSAQLQGTTLGVGIPRRAGLLVWNSSLTAECVSTGTVQGAYRLASSTSTGPGMIGGLLQCF